MLCSHNVHNNGVLGFFFFHSLQLEPRGKKKKSQKKNKKHFFQLFYLIYLLRRICVFVAVGGKVGGSSTWSGASDEAQEPESRRSGGR